MKAVISSTADPKYSFFIPIITWAWNKLNVGVVIFLPESSMGNKKIQLGLNCMNYGYMENDFYYFTCPEHKEATYAQCSRLYAACLDLPEDEILITSDIDMALFQIPNYDTEFGADFSIFGADLVPKQQYPICYLTATVSKWRDSFSLHNKTYQQCLDELLGHIEAEHFRGNYWGKDQEEAYMKIATMPFICSINRARPGTQFASKRYDRDDAYLLERLSPDTIDFHLPRPGYTQENFDIIMKVLRYHYPDENFDWLIKYHSEYIKLL